jgi:hypothetical protein
MGSQRFGGDVALEKGSVAPRGAHGLDLCLLVCTLKPQRLLEIDSSLLFTNLVLSNHFELLKAEEIGSLLHPTQRQESIIKIHKLCSLKHRKSKKLLLHFFSRTVCLKGLEAPAGAPIRPGRMA